MVSGDEIKLKHLGRRRQVSVLAMFSLNVEYKKIIIT